MADRRPLHGLLTEKRDNRAFLMFWTLVKFHLPGGVTSKKDRTCQLVKQGGSDHSSN